MRQLLALPSTPSASAARSVWRPLLRWLRSRVSKAYRPWPSSAREARPSIPTPLRNEGPDTLTLSLFGPNPPPVGHPHGLGRSLQLFRCRGSAASHRHLELPATA